MWLTDFVGWLPMLDGGAREEFLTADYNAEMIEQIARYPRVRDRAVFVGEPDDIVPERFGPELPAIREWTEEHYSFAGYVTGFDPPAFADRDALRVELGYRADERVCIVTVGGSGVGADLLQRVIASFPEAKRMVPELRMIAVAGPRIDPASLSTSDGLEVRAYVHDLYRHLAACDLAVVQGGLTTAMELTSNQRPFIYFPLKHHFEQHFHVHHRLSRYGAGRRMEFDDSPPDAIAAAIASELGREVEYVPVPRRRRRACGSADRRGALIQIDTDYLVIGAGASGLAFADALIAEADVEVTVIDRRETPGGHWADVYPFVRLHTPSAYYGVNSRALGEHRHRPGR